MNPTNRDGIFDGLCVMDVDTHISEPHDLWTENAPVSVRDRLPRVKEIDGAKHWIVDGDINLGAATPASVVRHDGNKSNGIEFFNWSMEEVHAASYDMEARVRLMDDLGIGAHVICPNVAGFGNQNFIQIADEDLRLAWPRRTTTPWLRSSASRIADSTRWPSSCGGTSTLAPRRFVARTTCVCAGS